MVLAQRLSEADYTRFVLTGAEGAWELHEGRLVEKPGMTWKHADVIENLGFLLRQQLDRRVYRVRENEERLRKPSGTVLIPDIAVIPTAHGDMLRDEVVLAVIDDPLPLVVEVWSPSTGEYDGDAKIPLYQQRGDLEIWRIHPYERSLTVWRRQGDDSYHQSLYTSGSVSPAALPGVTIELEHIFAS